jgi:hypothetical protein
MFTFSEQYSCSIVYVHLVAKLNTKSLCENVRNGKIHDSVIIFCRQRKKEVSLYISAKLSEDHSENIMVFRRRSKNRTLVSNVKSSNSGDQEKGDN